MSTKCTQRAAFRTLYTKTLELCLGYKVVHVIPDDVWWRLISKLIFLVKEDHFSKFLIIWDDVWSNLVKEWYFSDEALFTIK